MSVDSKDDVSPVGRRRLDSWKEIAAHLGKNWSLRTVQRWEADGLPVYREGVKVFAYTDELDRWRKDRIVGPSKTSLGSTPSPESRPSLPTIRMLVALLAVAAIVGAIVWAMRRPREAAVPAAGDWGRLLVRATSEGKSPTRIRLNQPADWIAVTTDGLKIYACRVQSRLLSVLHTRDGSLTTLTLQRDPGPLPMSPDGDRLYIGSTAGAMPIICTSTDHLLPDTSTVPRPVHA